MTNGDRRQTTTNDIHQTMTNDKQQNSKSDNFPPIGSCLQLTLEGLQCPHKVQHKICSSMRRTPIQAISDMPEIWQRNVQKEKVGAKFCGAKCLQAKCPLFLRKLGQNVLGQNVIGAKCQWGKMSPSRYDINRYFGRANLAKKLM